MSVCVEIRDIVLISDGGVVSIPVTVDGKKSLIELSADNAEALGYVLRGAAGMARKKMREQSRRN